MTLLDSTIGSMTNNLEMKGRITLNIVSNKIKLKLKDKTGSGSDCSELPSKDITCNAYYFVSGYQNGGSGGAYPSENQLGDFKELKGVLTSKCIQLKASDTSGGKEREYGLIGAVVFGGPVGMSTCGPDATEMQCGTLAVGKLKTCCQRSTSTCPSKGCDCYSSCN